MENINKFIEYCENMEVNTDSIDVDIANEGMLPYKTMRKLQTNAIALAYQYSQQKKDIQKRYKEADNQVDELEILLSTIKKRKKGMERKINGNEIKNKKHLQKFIILYDEWISKLNKEIN